MKAFIVGLLTGAALYAGADVMFSRHEAESPPPQSAASSESSDVLAQTLPDDVIAGPQTSLRSATVNATPESSTGIPLEGADLDSALFELMAEKSRRERASLDAEPRDPMWSASMEQQLREFIARHPVGDNFLITRIDCRTLYCEVEAEAPMQQHVKGHEDVGNAFTSLIEEMEQQFGMAVGARGVYSHGTMIRADARFRRFKYGTQCPPGFKEEDCWNR